MKARWVHPLFNGKRLFSFDLLALLFLSSGVQLCSAANANQGTWTQKGNLMAACTLPTATSLSNGNVLIAGGYGGSEELSCTELYQPKEGTFTSGPPMSVGRANHTATLLHNGQVLIVGGQFQGAALASAELYDPIANTWKATGSLHLARCYHTATLLSDGEVLVAGGARNGTPPEFPQGALPGTALDIAEVYDPSSGKWSVTENLHEARFVHTATLLHDGKVLVTGGLGSQGVGRILASAELYNPNTKSWTLTGSLSDPLFGDTATLLNDGKVLVAGGKPSYSGDTAKAELYDPSTGAWVPTESLPQPTNAHSATLLSDGRVMVAGGANSATGVLNKVDIYDPASGSWTPTGNLNTARSLHIAVLLPNDQVLVAGGDYALGSASFVQSSVEVYIPTGAATSEVVSNVRADDIKSPISGTASRVDLSMPRPPEMLLLRVASSLVVIAACFVVIAACAVVVLSVWVAFVLIERLRK